MAEWQAWLVPALGNALLHFLWQGALIGLVAAIALQLLRDARPQLRYAVACAALLACALVPMLGMLAALHDAWSGGSAATILPGSFSATAVMQQVFATRAWSTDEALPWIVAAWAAGAGSLSLRMTLGVIWIERLRNTPQGAMHPVWQARLDGISARFGLERVALRLVNGLQSPASAGWWRPVVLLPAALATRMPVDLIEALLAHELAHIRRHDYLINLLQGVIEAILFYHPVTWWLSRRIRIERELIADQLAVQATGDPHRLAFALSELSDIRSTSCPPLHLAQAAHGGQLMSRIEQLVRPDRRSTNGKLAFPLLGLAAACIAFYAHAQIADAGGAHGEATTPKPATHTTRLQVGKAAREAYALVRKNDDGITMSGSSDDMPAIRSAQRSIDGDFIWFRHDDKAYVVSDPSIVTRAQDAWRESNKVSARMEALGNEMEAHGARMEKLGAQMEKLSAGHAPSAAMQAASQRLETLAGQQQALAAQQSRLAASMQAGDDARSRQIERQMQALSEQQDALSRQMDEQARVMDAESGRMASRMQPMEALGRQMDEASKPMDALGKRMEILGKEQEKRVAQAERETKALLDEAMAEGLAKPAPGAAREE